MWTSHILREITLRLVHIYIKHIEGKGKVIPLQAQRVGRGIALLFRDRGTRSCEWSAARSGRTLPRKDPGPILQEAVWAPGSVWTGAENLFPTGIRSRTVEPVVRHYTY